MPVGCVFGPARRADKFVVVPLGPPLGQHAATVFDKTWFAFLADAFYEVVAMAVFASYCLHIFIAVEVSIVCVPALAHTIIAVVRVIVTDCFYGDDFHAYVWFLFHLYRVDEIVT